MKRRRRRQKKDKKNQIHEDNNNKTATTYVQLGIWTIRGIKGKIEEIREKMKKHINIEIRDGKIKWKILNHFTLPQILYNRTTILNYTI